MRIEIGFIAAVKLPPKGEITEVKSKTVAQNEQLCKLKFALLHNGGERRLNERIEAGEVAILPVIVDKKALKTFNKKEYHPTQATNSSDLITINVENSLKKS